MNDGEVANDRALMVAAVNTIALGVEDDVVADDGVGGGLDAVVAGVPDDVSFDDVGCFSVGVVDDDARIVGVVDDVVGDDIAVTAVFEFDAVALADGTAFEVVDVVVRDDGVENVAVGGAVRLVVRSEIEGFAMAAGVVDMVVAEGE